jgi:hypothetical protein
VGGLAGPGLVWMGCVVFAAVLLWGGRLLEAGHQSSNMQNTRARQLDREVDETRWGRNPNSSPKVRPGASPENILKVPIHRCDSGRGLLRTTRGCLGVRSPLAAAAACGASLAVRRGLVMTMIDSAGMRSPWLGSASLFLVNFKIKRALAVRARASPMLALIPAGLEPQAAWGQRTHVLIVDVTY